MASYDPKSASQEVNLVITALALRFVRAGLYECSSGAIANG